MFWKRKRGNFKDDLTNLRNGIQMAIQQCYSDLSTDPKNALVYQRMIKACYEALDALHEGNIDGVTKANFALQVARFDHFDHLEPGYHFSLYMENSYYDDYYEDYKYRP